MLLRWSHVVHCVRHASSSLAGLPAAMGRGTALPTAIRRTLSTGQPSVVIAPPPAVLGASSAPPVLPRVYHPLGVVDRSALGQPAPWRSVVAWRRDTAPRGRHMNPGNFRYSSSTGPVRAFSAGRGVPARPYGVHSLGWLRGMQGGFAAVARPGAKGTALLALPEAMRALSTAAGGRPGAGPGAAGGGGASGSSSTGAGGEASKDVGRAGSDHGGDSSPDKRDPKDKEGDWTDGWNPFDVVPAALEVVSTFTSESHHGAAEAGRAPASAPVGRGSSYDLSLGAPTGLPPVLDGHPGEARRTEGTDERKTVEQGMQEEQEARRRRAEKETSSSGWEWLPDPIGQGLVELVAGAVMSTVDVARDGIAGTGSIARGTVSATGTVAKVVTEVAGSSAKTVLPQLGEVPVPSVVQAGVSGSRALAVGSKTVVDTSVKAVSGAGGYAGRAVGGVVRRGVDSMSSAAPGDASSAERGVVDALGDLVSTTVGEVVDTYDTVVETVDDVVTSGREAVTDVIEHTLGHEVAGVANETLETYQAAVKTVAGVKTATSRKLLTKVAKEAQKGVVAGVRTSPESAPDKADS